MFNILLLVVFVCFSRLIVKHEEVRVRVFCCLVVGSCCGHTRIADQRRDLRAVC